MSSALEQLLEINAKIIEFNSKLDKFQKVVETLDQRVLTTIQENMAAKQTLISLGDVLTAISSCLVEKGLITNNEMMNKIRQQGDNRDREQIDSMVKAGLFKSTEVVNANSIVIVKQQIVNKETKEVKETLCQNRPIDLDDFSYDKSSTLYVNKKVGDIVEYSFGSNTETGLATIVEIYNISEVNKGGEQTPE